MTDIVLATANARYSHASLALRYLKANLRELEGRAAILEFTLSDPPASIAEKILSHNPRIAGLGVYIWNASLLAATVAVLKQVRPSLAVVLGGPEVSFEVDRQPIIDLADYVILGEGEQAFRELCTRLLGGDAPGERFLSRSPADPDAIALPYRLYTEQDIANRQIYVEASRGCPFGCEFCLSALDRTVRRFSEEKLLLEIGMLFERGARRFKFVDRALHLAVTPRLLDFFLGRASSGVFVHFELVPGHLPEPLFDRLQRFLPGQVQIEAGVQSLNPEVTERIGRRQDSARVLEMLSRLKAETGVHLHADLVAGLPGETLESFGRGFDRLMAIRPHEIQVGILKRLRGAPIARHDAEWGMVYNPSPPYDILQNRLIDFGAMQRLKRFARYFDLVYNSGRFASFCGIILGGDSPFQRFSGFSDWLYAETGQTSGIGLDRLTERLLRYAVQERLADSAVAAECLHADAEKSGGKGALLPPRQRRHH